MRGIILEVGWWRTEFSIRWRVRMWAYVKGWMCGRRPYLRRMRRMVSGMVGRGLSTAGAGFVLVVGWSLSLVAFPGRRADQRDVVSLETTLFDSMIVSADGGVMTCAICVCMF